MQRVRDSVVYIRNSLIRRTCLCFVGNSFITAETYTILGLLMLNSLPATVIVLLLRNQP